MTQMLPRNFQDFLACLQQVGQETAVDLSVEDLADIFWLATLDLPLRPSESQTDPRQADGGDFSIEADSSTIPEESHQSEGDKPDPTDFTNGSDSTVSIFMNEPCIDELFTAESHNWNFASGGDERGDAEHETGGSGDETRDWEDKKYEGEYENPEIGDTEAGDTLETQTTPPTISPAINPTSFSETLPVQIKAANALRFQRQLARALRPLLRKIPSRTQWQFDLEATAHQSVEQGIISPVLVPVRERWLDLALVVEVDPALPLWEDTLAELITLVERLGAFRQIRVWNLYPPDRDDGELYLAPRTSRVQNDRSLSSSLSPHSLCRSQGRTLIWLVSDCTSQLWDQPPIYQVLHQWGQGTPVALIQLLPERLWQQTALAEGDFVNLKGTVPGQAVARLQSQAIGLVDLEPDLREQPGEQLNTNQLNCEDSPSPQDDREAPLLLPVVTLEQEPLRRWARMTAGFGGSVGLGTSFEWSTLESLWEEMGHKGIDPRIDPGIDPNADLAVPGNDMDSTVDSAEERVQDFRNNASLTARQLAGYLAAAPLSLPVVYLVQQALLPSSTQVHVAEVFMGGLVQAVRQGEDLFYDFYPGVRTALLQTMPKGTEVQVLDALSQQVADHLGIGGCSFGALMALQSRLSPEQQQQLRPFAQVGLEVLKQLGDRQQELADRLSEFLSSAPVAEPTTVSPPPDTSPSGPTFEPYEITYGEWELDEGKNDDDGPALILEEVEFTVAQLVEAETAVEEDDLTVTRFNYTVVTLNPDGRVRERVDATTTGFVEILTKKRNFLGNVFDLGDSNQVPLEMIAIPGGEFLMGTPKTAEDSRDSERPQHRVKVSPFYLGRYPVTQAQWRIVAHWDKVQQDLDPDPSRFKGNNLPVERVSWYDAVEFCARLSQATGRDYRLPTEAEWEYACRAGTTTPFHFGETLTTDVANYQGTGNYGSYGNGPKEIYRMKTTEVGSFPANPWGLHDMHGNVWEWCMDDWHRSYGDKPDELKQDGGLAWSSSDGGNAAKSLRGGSWGDLPRNCRSAFRSYYLPVGRDVIIGFRVVCLPARSLL
jgi:formylglycine-generating enzyme required for sulfatase activity